jgi:hypothetical protein
VIVHQHIICIMAAAVSLFNDMPLLSSSNSHSQVALNAKAAGLIKMDTFSKSDPFAVFTGTIKGADVEFGRTEVIDDTQAPAWVKAIKVDYHFEEVQAITVRVYDEDQKGSADLSDHGLQGEATFVLSEVVTSPGGSVTKPLFKATGGTEVVKVRIPLGAEKGTKVQFKASGGRTVSMLVRDARPGTTVSVSVPALGPAAGTVTLMAEQLVACSQRLRLGLAGKKLANKDGFFGKSDPYYEILKSREDGSWVPVYRSGVLNNTLNPWWPPAAGISVQDLCNGDYDRPLRINVYDHDNDGSHDDMGLVETSLSAILSSSKTDELPVWEHNAKKGTKKRSGSLVVTEALVTSVPTFLDYVRSGWELNMVVGIDFTGSNGNPALPTSLHYRPPSGESYNAYETSILALSDVITAYDSDKKYPLFGFGGRRGGDPASHCFALNGDAADPSVSGVQGILDAYAGALREWGLSGPTNFSPLIREAASECRRQSEAGAKAYMVLLILTDGAITDLEATKTAIVEASDLPLSIVIVGVGGADFSAMVALDGDGGRLTAQNGRTARRDLVQFVRYLDHAGAGDTARLAAETLAELPTQMLDWFKANQVSPDSQPGAEPGGGASGGGGGLGEAGKRILQASVSR